MEKTEEVKGHRISVAPMMKHTNLHFRYFIRLLTRHTQLYTEMVLADAVVHNPSEVLAYNKGEEHPVTVQLGGADPQLLARAAALCHEYGYDEVNLNVGCPSKKVSGKNCSGARLMLRPELVGDILHSMHSSVAGVIPTTVKCRIGVDHVDSYEDLVRFIDVVSSGSGKGRWDKSPGLVVDHFVIHARKALLKGLSPTQNRSIPPLKYAYVYDLAKRFPDINFTLNGGVDSHAHVQEHLDRGIYGVMLGRGVLKDPYGLLAQADTLYFGSARDPGYTRREVLHHYSDYCERVRTHRPVSKRTLLVPAVPIFAGLPGGRKFRQNLDAALFRDGEREKLRAKNEKEMGKNEDIKLTYVGAEKEGASVWDVIEEALREVDEEVLDARPGQLISHYDNDDGVDES